MSRATVTIAYGGPALTGGVMDVRDLAPTLMAAGQLVEAANSLLNGDAAAVSVQVTATGHGSFHVTLQVVQSLAGQVVSLFTSGPVAAAGTIATLVFGTPATRGLIWLLKKCQGKRPTGIERISDSTVRIVIDGDVIEVPLALLRLYQDIPIRAAAQALVAQPLQRGGIDSFEVRSGMDQVVVIGKSEALYFERPEIPDETLVDEVRKPAYSIVSLAFKEDNKWRLNDGNNVISAAIADQGFLARVDANQISFSKGDILICEVRVTQRQTESGLRTEHIVERVSEHRPAVRQLPLDLKPPADPPSGQRPSQELPPTQEMK